MLCLLLVVSRRLGCRHRWIALKWRNRRSWWQSLPLRRHEAARHLTVAAFLDLAQTCDPGYRVPWASISARAMGPHPSLSSSKVSTRGRTPPIFTNGSTLEMYEPWAKSMGDVDFQLPQPPQPRDPQPIFMKLEIYNYLPGMRNFRTLCRRGWSGKIAILAVWIFVMCLQPRFFPRVKIHKMRWLLLLVLGKRRKAESGGPQQFWETDRRLWLVH